jgi:hypothetical protein
MAPSRSGRGGGNGLAVATAIIILLIVVVVLFRPQGPREGYTSRRAQEIYESSRALFEREGKGATFSMYKTALGGGTDPVLYTDVRRLWLEGRLTPEGVEAVL